MGVSVPSLHRESTDSLIRVGMVDFCLLRHLIAFQNCFLLVELKVAGTPIFAFFYYLISS